MNFMRTDDHITMTAIKRNMTRVINMHMSACGHEGPVHRAIQAEFELHRLIEAELDKRTKKLENFSREVRMNTGPG